jgi:hypothetical protein
MRTSTAMYRAAGRTGGAMGWPWRETSRAVAKRIGAKRIGARRRVKFHSCELPFRGVQDRGEAGERDVLLECVARLGLGAFTQALGG